MHCVWRLFSNILADIVHFGHIGTNSIYIGLDYLIWLQSNHWKRQQKEKWSNEYVATNGEINGCDLKLQTLLHIFCPVAFILDYQGIFVIIEALKYILHFMFVTLAVVENLLLFTIVTVAIFILDVRQIYQREAKVNGLRP